MQEGNQVGCSSSDSKQKNNLVRGKDSKSVIYVANQVYLVAPPTGRSNVKQRQNAFRHATWWQIVFICEIYFEGCQNNMTTE